MNRSWHRRVLCFGALFLAVNGRADLVFNLTTIDHPGNAPDHPYPDPGIAVGAVAYTYQITTYEVTVAQYCEFLNAKAQSDPYGLYSGGMGDGGALGLPRITRSASDG